MAKFKVGDRVHTHGGYTFDPGIGTINAIDRGVYEVAVDGIGDEWNYYEKELRLVTPAANPAIRTVTRREIVPGEYNGVTVDLDAGLHISLEWCFTQSEDLREAARLFNEIADVLDEQKEAA